MACDDAEDTVGTRLGTESHFLMDCDSDSECGSELSCLAGRCSIECDSDAECAELLEDSICVSASSIRSCDLPCQGNDDYGAGSQPDASLQPVCTQPASAYEVLGECTVDRIKPTLWVLALPLFACGERTKSAVGDGDEGGTSSEDGGSSSVGGNGGGLENPTPPDAQQADPMDVVEVPGDEDCPAWEPAGRPTAELPDEHENEYELELDHLVGEVTNDAYAGGIELPENMTFELADGAVIQMATNDPRR